MNLKKIVSRMLVKQPMKGVSFILWRRGKGGGGQPFFVCFCRLSKLVRSTILKQIRIEKCYHYGPQNYVAYDGIHQGIIEPFLNIQYFKVMIYISAMPFSTYHAVLKYMKKS